MPAGAYALRSQQLDEWSDWLEEQEGYSVVYGLSDVALTGGGLSPVTFPGTKMRFRVEILVNGVWVDISAYVKYSDKITITRGRRNEQSTVSASTCKFTLKHGTARLFAPRNTLSPFYPYLGQGTKLRVYFNPGSGDSLRFTGEVPDWTPRWTTGEDRSVTIEASGILRRLEQNQDPPKSCIRRYIETRAVQPIAYWPCEDDTNATQAESAISGVAPMIASAGAGSQNSVHFGQGGGRTQPAYTNFEILKVATAPLTSLGDGGGLRGLVPAGTSSPIAWTVQFIGRLWAYTGFAETDIVLARWETPGGTFTSWTLKMLSLDGGFQLLGDSTVLISPAITSVDLSAFRVTAVQNGANVDVTLRISRHTSTGESGSFDTDSRAGTLAYVRVIEGNPNHATLAHTSIGGSENQTNDIVFGHVQVYDTTTNVKAMTGSTTASNGSVVTPWAGFLNEPPTDRFARICTEEGFPYVISELVADAQTMGLQDVGTPLPLLRECEEVGEGLIDETRAGELRLTSRTARWVPDVLLTLDYADPVYGNQVNLITPTDDDFPLRNDWTVGRTGGSSVHVQKLTGPLNVNDREDDPEGAGRRRDSTTLNLSTDAQLADHAYWRIRQGTVDEPRYPLIKFRLDSHPELISSWLSMDVHSRLQVLNPPADVGTDTIAQYTEGYVEEATQVTWTVDANGSPVDTGEAWRWNDATGLARYDCRGSTLASAMDTTTTSVSLAITDSCVWGHDNGDYLIRIGGEDMLVTAVSAAAGTYPSQTQTLTVTRSMNAAVLAHAAGQRVSLKTPARYALGK